MLQFFGLNEKSGKSTKKKKNNTAVNSDSVHFSV